MKQRFSCMSIAAPWARAIMLGIGLGSLLFFPTPVALAETLPTRYVVEVRIHSKAEVDAFSAAGLIVGNLDHELATLYLTGEQLAEFDALGVAYRLVETQPSAEKDFNGYHTYAELTTDLQAYAAQFPALCRLYTLGQSIQGRELHTLLISDNPDIEEEEPEFKYVSTMHGDEPVGTELCMRLIDLLLNSYGASDRLTALVDTTAIWIVPAMNPDGLDAITRANASGFDLNRSFPAYPGDFVGTYFDGESDGTAGRTAEVRHVMNWTLENSFVLSANFHTGALVVNYPYDDDGLPSGVPAPSPDEGLFRVVSAAYADHNPPMRNSRLFPGGITNGNDWYRAIGGMQDWNYRFMGCFEVTIELSSSKRPGATLLPGLWEDNRESMLSYLEFVHRGVRGLITDRNDGAPLWGRVLAAGNTQPVFSDPDVGDYYRLLRPGTHRLRFYVPGYIPYSVDGVSVGSGAATRVDVPLSTGDIDNDGFVGATDIGIVVDAVLQRPTAYNCDVDGNGVSATDVQAVINRALGRPIAVPAS